MLVLLKGARDGHRRGSMGYHHAAARDLSAVLTAARTWARRGVRTRRRYRSGASAAPTARPRKDPPTTHLTRSQGLRLEYASTAHHMRPTARHHGPPQKGPRDSRGIIVAALTPPLCTDLARARKRWRVELVQTATAARRVRPCNGPLSPPSRATRAPPALSLGAFKPAREAAIRTPSAPAPSRRAQALPLREKGMGAPPLPTDGTPHLLAAPPPAPASTAPARLPRIGLVAPRGPKLVPPITKNTPLRPTRTKTRPFDGPSSAMPPAFTTARTTA